MTSCELRILARRCFYGSLCEYGQTSENVLLLMVVVENGKLGQIKEIDVNDERQIT